MKWIKSLQLGLLFTASLCSTLVSAARLLDMVDVQGVRGNQLVGYGLVVGLDGTGDKTRQTEFTAQSLNNMLRQLGIQLPADADPNLKNVAAVSVTAILPAFAGPGQNLDVTVSSLGDATSLQGGTLLMTQLKGVDGNIYALSQGNLVVTGINAEGKDGSSITVNVPTVARIPSGAIVERTVPNNFAANKHVILNLREPSFTTAGNIVRAINDKFGEGVAAAENGVKVKVAAPSDASQRVAYMSVLENMDIEEADALAKVVINSRTGTVVINKHVTLKPAAVSHGNLVVSIREDASVSQPAPFSEGATEVVPDSNVVIDQGDKRLFMMPEGSSLQEVVNAINSVGATPADLMAVLQALKTAGSLKAELVII
ncbi:flagellar biosynthesis protein FlgI [Endozoicomonas sp. (ex Bugula neritina AB1)]|nr:flagellar biosynthesis protein FlgI [Endozoicomonas sp. (ex Bugula neritina AB1)]